MKIYLKKILFIFTFTSLVLYSAANAFAQTSITVSVGVGETILIISGRSSPNSLVTFKESNVVIGTATTDSNGNFSKTFTPINAGIHTISLYVTDSNNNLTQTVSNTINVLEHFTTTINNIILPPTIAIDKTILTKGEFLTITGTGTPLANVNLFVFYPATNVGSTVNSSGYWQYVLNTAVLNTGTNYLYANIQTTDPYTSETSTQLNFVINEAPSEVEEDDEGDDSDTNETTSSDETGISTTTLEQTTDTQSTSIFNLLCKMPRYLILYDYNKDCKFVFSEFSDAAKSFVRLWIDKSNKSCDINNDSRCNLTDFSIMLFYIDR